MVAGGRSGDIEVNLTDRHPLLWTAFRVWLL